MQQSVPLAQTKTLIREKQDYYNALERNGWKLPMFKCKFLNSEVLQMIRERKIYCPKYEELNLRPCPNPPSELDVRDELVQLIQANINQVGPADQPRFQMLEFHLQRAPADRQWMLDVISTLSDGNHHYFGKSYMAPPKMRNRNQQQIDIDNQDGFFTGLPQSHSKRKMGTNLVLTPLQKQQLKIEKLQQQQQRQLEKIQAEQVRLQQISMNYAAQMQFPANPNGPIPMRPAQPQPQFQPPQPPAQQMQQQQMPLQFSQAQNVPQMQFQMPVAAQVAQQDANALINQNMDSDSSPVREIRQFGNEMTNQSMSGMNSEVKMKKPQRAAKTKVINQIRNQSNEP